MFLPSPQSDKRPGQVAYKTFFIDVFIRTLIISFPIAITLLSCAASRSSVFMLVFGPGCDSPGQGFVPLSGGLGGCCTISCALGTLSLIPLFHGSTSISTSTPRTKTSYAPSLCTKTSFALPGWFVFYTRDSPTGSSIRCPPSLGKMYHVAAQVGPKFFDLIPGLDDHRSNLRV